MANDIDINLRVNGADEVKSKIDKNAESADKADTSFRKAGQGAHEASGGMSEAAKAAGELSHALKDAGEAAGVYKLLGGIHALAEQSDSIEDVQKRMESIFKAQGKEGDVAGLEKTADAIGKMSHIETSKLENSIVLLDSYSVKTKDIGELLPLVARQSRTMGLSLDEVANQMGKAYSSGNIGMLRRAGVVIDQQAMASVKAAYAISDTVGQMKFMEVVTKSLEGNTANLDDSMSEGSKAAGDMKRSLEDLATGPIGKEAAHVFEQVSKAIGTTVTSVNDFSKAHPTLAQFATDAAIIGGGAFVAVKGITSLSAAHKALEGFLKAGSVAARGAAASKTALTAATEADIAAEKAKAGVAAGEGKAIGAVGKEAEQTAAKMGLLSRIQGLASKTISMGQYQMTAGNLATGAALGAGAGFVANQAGESNEAAIATGVATSFVAAIAPPWGKAAILTAEIVGEAINHYYSDKLEKEATEGTGGSKEQMDEMYKKSGELEESGKSGHSAKAQTYYRLAQEAEARGDQTTADTYRLTAGSEARIAREENRVQDNGRNAIENRNITRDMQAEYDRRYGNQKAASISNVSGYNNGNGSQVVFTVNIPPHPVSRDAERFAVAQ